MSTQSAWNAASTAYAGIAVCGCKGQVITGKKLYRLVNYIKTVKGLALVDTPPPTDGGFEQIINVYRFDISWPGGPFINIFWGGYDFSTTAIFQLGKGLANPVVTTATYYIPPTDPLYNVLLGPEDGDVVQTCYWDENDTPKGVFGVPFYDA
jgi:hypothetical protein